MNINLPVDFINKMNNRLKDEAESFFDSYNDAPVKAFHINEKLLSSDSFVNSYPEYKNNQLTYYSNGFYDFETNKIGHTPLNHAGAVYSQDPAAMMPVSIVKPYVKKDFKVLDLCSAPGGKASQIAMLLDDETGFLVSNEINPSRNKILSSNIERLGYKNVITTKLDPSEVSVEYAGYFNLVIVDAPCSGEGMFRKYPESTSEWSIQNVNMCANRQIDILTEAVKCLAPNGYLLYSTCTYSEEEDDNIISWLIDTYKLSPILPHVEVLNITKSYKYNEGRTFYPHIAKGEGQYMCLLQKNNDSFVNNLASLGNINKINKATKKMLQTEIDSFINIDYEKLYIFKNKVLYITNPNVLLPSKGITGAFITIGDIEKNKFTPSHQLFHSLGHLFTNKLNLQKDDDRIYKYLHGEEIFDETVNKGYGAITYMNCPIGGFKASGGRLKNHYPKGLRNNN